MNPAAPPVQPEEEANTDIKQQEEEEQLEFPDEPSQKPPPVPVQEPLQPLTEQEKQIYGTDSGVITRQDKQMQKILEEVQDLKSEVKELNGSKQENEA